ncbi:MAG: DUF3881 family protein [Eubacterium sp.]|nr:DUF3881 family protein [Eubacterium sp.]
MNKYLSAIGFSKIKSIQQLDRLHREVMRNPDHRTVAGYSLSHTLVQLDKSFGEGIGISLVGEMDSAGSFLAEYAFPFILPGHHAFTDEVIVEEDPFQTAYSGVLDNVNLSVIFAIQNVAYVRGLIWNNKLPEILLLSLSGLSLEGVILLPMMKTPQDREYEMERMKKELAEIHNFRKGDDSVIDRLMLRDMDIKDTLEIRSRSEDILSIVDSSLIPFGTESDIFDVIGTVVAVSETENTLTKEKVYLLDVACLYYIIRIAINKENLQGEPVPGRRFRGITWLQGAVLAEPLPESKG